jgi:hypothetical protein
LSSEVVVDVRGPTATEAVAPATDVPSTRRALLVVATFVAGIVLGVLVYVLLNVRPAPVSFPTVPSVSEPREAAAVAAAIAQDDARTLSNLLTDDLLAELSDALSPLVDVTEVKFVRAVSQNGVTLSAYVAKGHTQEGASSAAGFVLWTRDGQIVKVNRKTVE